MKEGRTREGKEIVAVSERGPIKGKEGKEIEQGAEATKG